MAQSAPPFLPTFDGGRGESVNLSTLNHTSPRTIPAFCALLVVKNLSSVKCLRLLAHVCFREGKRRALAVFDHFRTLRQGKEAAGSTATPAKRTAHPAGGKLTRSTRRLQASRNQARVEIGCVAGFRNSFEMRSHGVCVVSGKPGAVLVGGMLRRVGDGTWVGRYFGGKCLVVLTLFGLLLQCILQFICLKQHYIRAFSPFAPVRLGGQCPRTTSCCWVSSWLGRPSGLSRPGFSWCFLPCPVTAEPRPWRWDRLSVAAR